MNKDAAGNSSPELDAGLEARLTDWGRQARSATGPQRMPDLSASPARQQSHLGWPLLAGGLAVALAATIVVGLPRLLGRSSEPLGGATSTAAPGPGLQVVTFHGLSITVPAAWRVAGYSCQLTSSVVELPGASPACGRRPYPEFTIVQFFEGTQPLPKESVSRTTRTTISGLPATRIEADRAVDPYVTDRAAFGYVVPKLHASVLIQPAQGQTGQDLAASLRVDAVDMHGCSSTVSDVAALPRSATSDRIGMTQALIPGQPVSASVCRYQAGWLEKGSTLSGAALRAFAATLNGLPVGLSRARDLGLTTCRDRGSVGSLDNPWDSEAYRIEVRYPDGPPVLLIARLGACGDLGISNGARTGQRTNELLTLLIRTVGASDGVPAPVVPAP